MLDLSSYWNEDGRIVVVVYYDNDVVSTFEGLLFECSNSPKFIKISEKMLFATLRKAVTDVIGGGRTYLRVFFYRKLVYVGDGCVEYNCVELKDNNEVGNIFFIF